MKVKRLALLLCALGVLWFSTFWLFFYLPPEFIRNGYDVDQQQRSLRVGDYRTGLFIKTPSRLTLDLDTGELVREPKVAYTFGDALALNRYEQHRPEPNEVVFPGEWKRYRHWRKPAKLGDEPLVFRFPCTPKTAGTRYAVGVSWNSDHVEFHWVDLSAEKLEIHTKEVDGYGANLVFAMDDPFRVVINSKDYPGGPWTSRLYAVHSEELELLAQWAHATHPRGRPSFVRSDEDEYLACQEDFGGELVLRSLRNGDVARRLRLRNLEDMAPNTYLEILENGLAPVTTQNGKLEFHDFVRGSFVASTEGKTGTPSVIYDVRLGKAFWSAMLPNNTFVLGKYQDGQLTAVGELDKYPQIMYPDEYVIQDHSWGGTVDIYSAVDGNLDRRFLPHIWPVCGSLVLVLGWVILGYYWNRSFLRPFHEQLSNRPATWCYLAGWWTIPVVVCSLGQVYSCIWMDDSTLGQSIMMGVAVGAISLALVHLCFGSFRFSARTIVLASVVTAAVLLLSRTNELDGDGFAWIGLAVAPFAVVMVCTWGAKMIYAKWCARRDKQRSATSFAADKIESSEVASRLSLRDLLLVTGSVAMLVAILTPWLSDVSLQVPLSSFWICNSVFTFIAVAVLLANRKPVDHRAARYTLIGFASLSCCVAIVACYANFLVPNLSSTIQFTLLYALAFSTGSLTFAWGHLWFSAPRRAVL